MNISQKKLSHVWLISPWLPKPVLRARLKHLVKSIKKEDAALKREGLENLQEEQLKAVSQLSGLRLKFHEMAHAQIHFFVPANAIPVALSFLSFLWKAFFYMCACVQSFLDLQY